MGWADLFKPKSSRGGADPRVRWFGKLPSYPDYYSSPADETWAVEFNEWVLRGFELYQSRLSGVNARHARLPIGACALRLPKSGMTVLASVLDYGGDMRGRPFPICFYVGLPTSQWTGPTSDRLSGAARVLRDLLALRREIPRFLNSPGRFESVFGGREVDLAAVDGDVRDTSWTEQARALRLDQWFQAARIASDSQDQAAWLECAARWGETIAGLDSKKFEPTIRFPLSAGSSIEVQVSGWIRWLESRMNLKRRSLSIFISGEVDADSGRLTLVAREPMADDFLLLTSMAASLSYVDDLCAGRPADDSSAAAAAAVRPSVAWGDTWLEFVEAGP